MHPEDEPSFNLMKILPESLRNRMPLALRKAFQGGETTFLRGVRLKKENEVQVVDVAVRPARISSEGQKLVLVLFEDRPSTDVAPGRKKRQVAAERAADPHIEELERELQDTRENLQATIEELEASNEELKSMNEELQSTNEELQSMNEEMMTAREEQQSTNEELVTVNSELQSKVTELMEVETISATCSPVRKSVRSSWMPGSTSGALRLP